MAALSQYYQRAKNGFHALQALIIFIGAAITVAIFTQAGWSDGRISYYFALCWFCIPALIYQTAFPIFKRTKRYANAYAHAIVDIIYTILWFAAFIGEAVRVKQGSHAAKDWKSSDRLCDKFGWGPVSKCKLGQATLGLAVVIWLLFALTTAFSIYGVSFYRRNGTLPGDDSRGAESLPIENQEEYAFSSNTHDKFDVREERQDLRPGGRVEEEYSALHNNMEANSSAKQDFEPVDTSYHSGTQPYNPHQSHSASDPFHDDTAYNTLHTNESRFVGEPNPQPLLTGGGGDPFREDLGLSHDHGGYASGGRVDFPAGDYNR